MRILLDYRPALRERTGVGEYVHELARALQASAPPDETLLLFSSSWKDRLAADVVPGASIVDRRIPVRALNLLWHRLAWPPVEALAGPVDVAQSAHPLLMPARGAARLVTVYDLDFLDHPERTTAEIRRDYSPLAAAHARRADRVVTISRYTAGEIERRLGVPAERIAICSPGAPEWPRRPAEPDDGCLLFVGTLAPRKNLDALLDAYERLLAEERDVPHLVLAGRVPASAEALVARTRRPPLAGRVELTGYVDDAARPALYDRALMLVLPSHDEGFGLPAVEAMTRGIPVVAARRGALPEVIGHAGSLVEPDQPGALAHAIGELLTDPARRERLRVLGWDQARRFSWADAASALRDAWGAALVRRRNADG